MKKQMVKMNMLAGILLFSAMPVITMSFDDAPRLQPVTMPIAICDTPKKNSVCMDLDTVGLHKALQDLNRELKAINWDNISKEIQLSLRSIDVAAIQKEVERSMQKIDWEKIKIDVSTSLQDINIDDIKINVQKAIDNIKLNIRSQEFKKNMKNLKMDTDKIKKEIRKVQKEIQANRNQVMNHIRKVKQHNGNEVTNVRESYVPQETKNISFPEKDRLFFLI